jgi:hypothetical protein
MKEIILIYAKDCIDSENALDLINEVAKEKPVGKITLVEFSFKEAIIKKLNIMITPTFVIDNRISFVGTPTKDLLLKEIA